MRGNVCQLWINCPPALTAPFNRYILCDHKWNSFKHFFFIISTLLTFPVRESWRDTRERRGSPEVSAGVGGGDQWSGCDCEHIQWSSTPATHGAQNAWLLANLTTRVSARIVCVGAHALWHAISGLTARVPPVLSAATLSSNWGPPPDVWPNPWTSLLSNGMNYTFSPKIRTSSKFVLPWYTPLAPGIA